MLEASSYLRPAYILSLELHWLRDYGVWHVPTYLVSIARKAPRKGIMAERLAAISFSLSEAAFESSSSCSSGPCRVRMAPVVVFVVDLA